MVYLTCRKDLNHSEDKRLGIYGAIVTVMVVWRQCHILWFVMSGQRVSSQQSLDQAGRGYVTSVTTAEE